MKRHKKEAEEQVHTELVSNYEKYYRFAYSYVHNEADALDIVQEAAYKAIYKSDTLKNTEYAGSWIYRILVNEANEFLRKKKRLCPTAEIQEDSSEDAYRDFDLEEAIEKLDPEDRTIVTLRYFEDMELSKIAWIMDENINTVKSRLYRALKKLRVSLAE